MLINSAEHERWISKIWTYPNEANSSKYPKTRLICRLHSWWWPFKSSISLLGEFIVFLCREFWHHSFISRCYEWPLVTDQAFVWSAFDKPDFQSSPYFTKLRTFIVIWTLSTIQSSFWLKLFLGTQKWISCLYRKLKQIYGGQWVHLSPSAGQL